MEDNARTANAAYKDARDLLAKLKDRSPSAANDAVVKQLEDLAPPMAEPPAGGGRGGRGGGGGGGGFGFAAEPAGPANLSSIAAQLVAAVQPMQSSEMPPTAAQLEACHKAETDYSAVMAKWTAVKAKTAPPASATGGGAAAKK